MASSDAQGNDPGRAVESDVARYADQPADVAAAHIGETGGEAQPSRRLGGYRGQDHSRMIKEAREAEFPIVLRGYRRRAVDRYVTEVNRLITELEMTASPESAVRRALEEVSEETKGLLERAHQTADDITARSRAKADDRLKQAEAEAEALRVAAQQDADAIREEARRETDRTREAAHREVQQVRTTAQREVDRLLGDARREAGELIDAAETRARELAHNAEILWRERRRLMDDVRAVGEQLMSIGEAEARRFPRMSEAIPAVSVPSRGTAAPQQGNGGAEPQWAKGGSDVATDGERAPEPSTGAEQ